jgi:glycolate oxidase iron-sulfur subunit
MNRNGFAALDPCVHCGFCLPACPTYLATGDENDSPRGRIVLMRALERGEIPANDPALREHLELCLGCRGCEPVCPAGVGYGRGLTAAREHLYAAKGLPWRARFILALFRREALWRPMLTAARWLRGTGIPDRFPGGDKAAFAMQMLASTRRYVAPEARSRLPGPPPATPAPARGTVALFRGCVMDTLFRHVHAATRRTLVANGYQVVEVAGQTCCGALHEHAGDRERALDLLTRNARALAGMADAVAVNSAGCGAHLRDAGHLAEALDQLGRNARDVTELLADAGPRPGAPLPLEVAYDAPCHLEHAQGVRDQPLQVLAAIPELRVRRLPGSDRCCGSAGIYSLLHGEMSRTVLERKVEEIAAAVPRPDLVVTGNPGCLMQIGAGLRAARLPIRVAHPVELLDLSYQRAGLYRN